MIDFPLAFDSQRELDLGRAIFLPEVFVYCGD
jgi:hypothetical protein